MEDEEVSSPQLGSAIDFNDQGPPRKYHGVDNERYEFLLRRLSAFAELTDEKNKKKKAKIPSTEKLLSGKQTQSSSSSRARRSDFSLQEWTERDRMKREGI